MNNCSFRLNYKLIKSLCCFISLFFASTFSKASSKEEHYFLTNNGQQVLIKKVIRLTSDTVFLTTIEGKDTFLIVDSISVYHHYKPRKGGTGFLIGGLIGSLVGGIVGAVVYQPIPEQSNPLMNSIAIFENQADESAAIGLGALIGFGAGGSIGLIIGNNSKLDMNIDLSDCTREEKKYILSKIFTEPHPSSITSY
jgi:hypothetical protein